MRLVFFGLGLLLLPSLVFAGVVINEVAWMGTESSPYEEWVELYDDSEADVDLSGWILEIQDKKDIILEGSISSDSYYLIERRENIFSDILADLMHSFGSGLSNDGAVLILKNSSGDEIDRIDASEGWPAGNNTTKETMQKSGSEWITATGTPKAEMPTSDVLPPDGSSTSDVSPDSAGQAFDVGEYVPPEELPKIKAYAGEDKTVVVGALSEFRGMGFGLNNEPMERARYLWNFGDGTSKEGQNIFHHYQYPGEYMVVLDVSSGQYASSDSFVVKVVPSEIFVSEIKTGINSFIELVNKSKEEINISNWRFRWGTQTFTFPKGTFIRPASYLAISNSVSGIIIVQGKGIVELLYPGGFLADSFDYNGVLAENQSFSRCATSDVYIAQETPGEENAEVPAPEEQSIEVESPDINGRQYEEVRPQEFQETPSVEEEPELVEGDGKTLGVEVEQEANIITITDKEISNKMTYFLLVFGLAILAGLGVFLIRRQRSP